MTPIGASTKSDKGIYKILIEDNVNTRVRECDKNKSHHIYTIIVNRRILYILIYVVGGMRRTRIYDSSQLFPLSSPPRRGAEEFHGRSRTSAEKLSVFCEKEKKGKKKIALE